MNVQRLMKKRTLRRTFQRTLVVLALAAWFLPVSRGWAAESRVAVVLRSEGEVTLHFHGIQEPTRTLQVVPSAATLKLPLGSRIKLRFLSDGHHEVALGPCEVAVKQSGMEITLGAGEIRREAPERGKVKIPEGEDVRRAGGELQAQNPGLPAPVAVAYEQPAPTQTQVETAATTKNPRIKTQSVDRDVTGGGGRTSGASSTAIRVRSQRPLQLPKVSYFTSGAVLRLYPRGSLPENSYRFTLRGAGVERKVQGLSLSETLPPGNYQVEVTAPGYRAGLQKVVILEPSLAKSLEASRERARSLEEKVDYLASLLQYSLLHEAMLYNERLVKHYSRDSGLWAQLGWIWDHLGDERRSRACFQKARQLEE